MDKKLEILRSENGKYRKSNLKQKIKYRNRLQKINPTLSALSIMEKRDIQNRISSNKLQIVDLEKVKEDTINNACFATTSPRSR